jgi:glutamine amidotransferase-like uncharacterized protein
MPCHNGDGSSCSGRIVKAAFTAGGPAPTCGTAYPPVGATFEMAGHEGIKTAALDMDELTLDMAAHYSGGGRVMNNNSNPVRRPIDLIDQATAIIMDRFGLNTAQALELLRKMSQNTRTQISVVAEQVINHHVPVEAIRGLEEILRDFG